MSWRQRLIREKIEATYGTDPVLAATDALMALDVSMRNLEADYQQQDFATGEEGSQAEDLYNLHVAVEYALEAAPSGVAGTPPPYAHILQSSGLTMATDLASVTFTPTPPNGAFSSTTMGLRNGAVMQTVTGVRGSMGFTAEVNRKARFTFNRQGIYADPVAFAHEPHDFSAWPRGLVCSPDNMGAITLGGTTLKVRSFSFADGRSPVFDKYMNVRGTDITGRRYTGQMAVQWPDLATKDILSDAKDIVIQPLVWTLGTVAGSILTVSAPRVQMKFAGEQEIERDLGATLDLVFLPDQGDDEIEIKFT